MVGSRVSSALEGSMYRQEAIRTETSNLGRARGQVGSPTLRTSLVRD